MHFVAQYKFLVIIILPEFVMICPGASREMESHQEDSPGSQAAGRSTSGQ